MNSNAIKRNVSSLGALKKMLLVMKLTFLVLIIAMPQVNGKSFAQRITLNNARISAQSVINEIKKQSGFNIFYKDIDLSQFEISVNIMNVSLEEALKECLNGLPVHYDVRISDKIIYLKGTTNASNSLLEKIKVYFKSIDVRGKVVDSIGNPLVGALIKTKGSKKSTSTNRNGEFMLTGIDEDDKLIISFLGYQSRELKVQKDVGTITLVEIIDNLKEVEINAGYYTVKDKLRTGAISRITSKEIERQPISNVLQAMQANIPGVQVTQTTGVPGGGFNVQIRGRNSISQGNNPFYVIDGVPFTAFTPIPISAAAGSQIIPSPSPLASINPSDIESIEVLKDGDATAIYGSRGANGVILITTKKGKVGPASISVSLNQGISRVGRKIDLMNTTEYINMRKEALANDNLQILSTDYDLNGAWGNERNTDWQEELIGKNALTNNFQSSISGGTTNVQYQGGIGYYKEGTVFPGDHSFQRVSGNLNLQYKSNNDKFSVSMSTNFSGANNTIFREDIVSRIFLAPNYPALLKPDGTLNWENNTLSHNPIAATRNPLSFKTKNLVGNGIVSYFILPELKISASLGYTTMSARNYGAVLAANQNPASAVSSAGYGNNSLDTWIVEPQVSWKRKFEHGTLDLLVGTTFQENITEGENLAGSGYTSDQLLRNIGAASLITVSSRQYLQYRYTAVYSRVNYTINNKYILNLTARRDGSSRFGNQKRFANFGAVGAAWVISDEAFMKKQRFISFAKLRSSYGITGNDNIRDYAYLSLWANQNDAAATYQGKVTIRPEGLANPEYAWEINKKAEFALDLGFIDEKIKFSTSYYSNRSSNQLVSRQLAPTVGFSSIQDNIPAVVSNTGWEFTLNSNNISTKNFIWQSSVNLTIPKNKLVSYPNLKSSQDAAIYEIGYPLDVSKRLNSYVDKETGLYAFEDYDHNNLLNTIDQYILRDLGRKFYGGIQNILSYENFEFDFLIQFVKQTGRFSLVGAPGRLNFGLSNQPVKVSDRWQKPGDDSYFQKYSSGVLASSANNRAQIQGGIGLQDASFIKLKNISLSYSLPEAFSKKISTKRTKLYVQAQNVFTLTKYTGLDPESPSNSSLPALQVFSAGLQLTF